MQLVAFDDLDDPTTCAGCSRCDARPLVTGIGEDAFDKGKQCAGGRVNELSPSRTSLSILTLEKKAQGHGDAWTWTAICADTKLIASWFIGDRTAETDKMLTCDLASRLVSRVQITSDGHRAYLEVMDAAFGDEVDYSQLVKVYPCPSGESSCLNRLLRTSVLKFGHLAKAA